MDGEIVSPEQAVEDSSNTTATAAMDTTPPTPTKDGKTSLSNDEGSAWTLVQRKRRTQADLLVSQSKQGAKTSELHGKTTQHKPMKSRPPPLPLHDYKAILRPLGGLRLGQWTRPALTRDIGVTAGLPPVEADRLVFRLRPERNHAVVSTSYEHIALNLYSVEHLRPGEHTYPVSIYIAAPDNSCKGIIHDVDPGTSPCELMYHLVALATSFAGTNNGQNEHSPHYLQGTSGSPLHTLLRRRIPVLRASSPQASLYSLPPMGHPSNHCPTPNRVTCKICGLDNPTSEHSCTPKCRSCGGDHPTTDRGCPARARPPLNKERVRNALQQEQQQRVLEHHPTPSSSSGGDLQAASPTSGRTSRSRSRSTRSTRSKARSRTHSRTGSQPPPAKRTTSV
ncbi:hypothetical protein HPB50_006573 [Hyalomma asiaticum]|uniref:Uncharacterized protein n=1 Tax=Hyalomma asiaticum TaxID=266040 RepID=A0ACB7RUL5_HYAAI|nr:hypothetical protein HPB50_006573 [Hyalomma asiaticum]